MYAFERQVKELEQRLEKVEEILKLVNLDPDELTPEMLCDKLGHTYKRVEYDLQGGKWGRERCSRCRKEYEWSV
jgi:hypothetical protein